MKLYYPLAREAWPTLLRCTRRLSFEPKIVDLKASAPRAAPIFKQINVKAMCQR